MHLPFCSTLNPASLVSYVEEYTITLIVWFLPAPKLLYTCLLFEGGSSFEIIR